MGPQDPRRPEFVWSEKHGNFFSMVFATNKPKVTLLLPLCHFKTLVLKWSGRWDSNPWPPRPERGALAKLRYAPILFVRFVLSYIVLSYVAEYSNQLNLSTDSSNIMLTSNNIIIKISSSQIK